MNEIVEQPQPSRRDADATTSRHLLAPAPLAVSAGVVAIAHASSVAAILLATALLAAVVMIGTELLVARILRR